MTAVSSKGPRVCPVLDPSFLPAALANRAFAQEVSASGRPTPVQLALEQADGSVFHFRTEVLPADHPQAARNFRHVERFAKFLLWSRGGFRLHVAGPRALGEELAAHYRASGAGAFDANLMGARVYERPFEVKVGTAEDLPAAREATRPLGRHWNGCRIGFDLGASDVKVAAVIDGKPVFSEEYGWSPVGQKDPQWHYDQIDAALRQAAARLPRVDGVGGSSAGVYVNNRVKVASLFRGVAPELFEQRVKGLFLELQKAWGGIPFEVVNDGEVTALAGSMSFNANAVLGLAMGSSEATGYVTPDGNITSWLNELAFAPVDYRENGPVDEWSGDRGCGVQYFSQQGVGRLMPAAGIAADPGMGLPDKLKLVQELMAKGDAWAERIYQTIGVYLGYTIAHYADFYTIHNMLILGRVTTGLGGAVILDEARKVLELEFPDLTGRLQIRTPDERDKRHGQAIAAASLPWIG
jgi:predicted NBD/HSP70 family sugar kinase